MTNKTILSLQERNRNLVVEKKREQKKSSLLLKHNRQLMRDTERKTKDLSRLITELTQEKRDREELQVNFEILSGNKMHDMMSDLKMYREYYIENVSMGM